MRYSRNIWQQLKNITADDLIAALERDGWQRDQSEGSFIPYINPNTRTRVIIHYHPRKTYGPNLLKSLLEDIGWDEHNLLRIGLITGKSKSVLRTSRIAEVGDENPNGQLFACETDLPGTDHNQYIWELLWKQIRRERKRFSPPPMSKVPGWSARS